MAKTVEVIAHGSLVDFLSSVSPLDESAHRRFLFDWRSLAKDAIEGIGIPHPEVDLLLANGASVSFEWELQDGTLLEAFPPGHPETDHHPSLVRPPPLAEPRFLVDENLGKLATFLLILGFDVLFDPRLDDPDLALKSAEENRILLTRDIGLLKRGIVTYGYWVRSDDPRRQVSEVIRRFGLWPRVRPFTRCLECNVELELISKDEAHGSVPPIAHALYSEFYRCEACEKVFWKGSHYDRMKDWLQDLEDEFVIRPSPVV